MVGRVPDGCGDEIRETGRMPYSELFIYHVLGRVEEEDEELLGDGFIGNWVEDDSSFLFFSVPSEWTVRDLLKKRAGLNLLDDYRFTYDEWQGGGLAPLKIGPFLIVSPWEETRRESSEIRIKLDPGVVFGTGLHPTTRDCLRALDYVRREDTFRYVLDLGTGTGILSIAAAYLGAERVVALDLNPLCVKTARKNVALNGLGKVIEVIEGDAGILGNESADLIVLNIHHEVISGFIETGGLGAAKWVIISGLMRSAGRQIRARLGDCGLCLVREWDHEMTWYTMIARNVNGG